ncbi:sigma-70 family RNA polymerase sigma factor [Paraflavitalea pollutisoli]|uniref:sigma-70 family RNA polymerase sigma factor n=1 Tax=Paraflavitalea pollutisoli TaxID=3034143 RepID=UPI0023EAB79A|nr:sigma-70 family RNA polymerase sigma factor [Paraflavitalea sp. H1-2-19X]
MQFREAGSPSPADKSRDLFWATFYENHITKYFAYAAKWVNDREERTDIVLNALASTMRMDGQQPFPSEEEVAKYLYVAVRNGCFKQLMRQKRRAITNLDWATPPDDWKQESGLAFYETIEMEEIIRKLIGSAVGTERIILEKFLLESKDSEEIAAELNITLQSVYTIKSRALTKIRNRYPEWAQWLVSILLIAQ